MLAGLLALVVLLAGCGGAERRPSPDAGADPQTDQATRTTPPTSPAPTTVPGPTLRPAAPRVTEQADPRWRFYSADRRRHTSPWYASAHRVMIGFGCTDAPYYAPDPACPDGQGSHHGIDVAMPCGTPLLAGRPGRVLPPDAPGAPGPAYGAQPFRIRTGGHDVLIAHARQVLVRPGETVRAGQRIARASDSGAPDGCHLHLEVRPAGGDVDTAVDPAPWLALEPE